MVAKRGKVSRWLSAKGSVLISEADQLRQASAKELKATPLGAVPDCALCAVTLLTRMAGVVTKLRAEGSHMR